VLNNTTYASDAYKRGVTEGIAVRHLNAFSADSLNTRRLTIELPTYLRKLPLNPLTHQIPLWIMIMKDLQFKKFYSR
jgi:hypothetical protein